MTSIGWLHLADLHQTLRRPGWPTPHVQREVFDDLARLHEQSGPWDLVIVAGDLSMRGAPEELEEAERTLDELLDHIRRLDGRSDPCLLAVPGNHDLARANGPLAGLRALRRWHEDPSVREEFWNDPESPARRMVDRALEPFERWWNARAARGFGKPVSIFRPGLLPGDFTATVDTGGVRVGVAGLCSTFLQVTGDTYEGRLAVAPHQLTVAAGGDVPSWIAQHDAAILVTHHAPHWLAPEERRTYEDVINPAGRFAVHLSAHMHEAAPLIEQGERVQVRCPSFFGLDAWEDRRGQPGQRRYGYNAARLFLDAQETRLEIHPREWAHGRIRPAFTLADPDPEGKVTLPVSRFPRLDEKAPGFSLERAALRDALAAIYRSPSDARRLAREAHVRVDHDDMRGASVDVWHVVVAAAERQGRLETLMRIVQIEYPSARDVAQAWLAYQRASQPSAIPTRSAHAMRGVPVDQRLGDALYERLSQLQPAQFESVLFRASLVGRVPGASAPQSTRAMAAVRLAEEEGTPGLERLARALLESVSTITVQIGPTKDGTLPVATAAAVLKSIDTLVTGSWLAGSRRPRVPTKPTLTKLLSVMFSDERDFDGFVLHHYPEVYRKYTNGMNRAYRIRLLLDGADPAEIVAHLKRSEPSAFGAHQRLLDYEEPGDSSLVFTGVRRG